MAAKEDDKNVWAVVGRYTSLAVMLPAAAFVGYAIGYVIDRHFHTGKVFQLIFLLLGVAAGMIEFIRVVSREP
jgi:F0F1-type ATP synthase assembly protein I